MRNSSRLGIFLILAASVAFAADAPPANKKKKLTLQDLINGTAGPSKKTTAVAGVRGLDETQGDIDTHARDYAAIERLEQVIVHDDELKAFADEGHLK